MVEVELRASTRVGEGPPSITRVTLTSQVAAGIYTHGDHIKGHQGQDITLLCNSVGDPSPRVEWKHQSRLIHDSNSPETEASGDKRKLLLQGNGRLLIQDAQRADSGNYTCTASNVHGSDQIAHVLTVLGKELYYQRNHINIWASKCTPSYFVISDQNFFPFTGIIYIILIKWYLSNLS